MTEFIEADIYMPMKLPELITTKINFDNINTLEDLKEILKALDLTFTFDKYKDSDIKDLYNKALLIKEERNENLL